ncbi:MAG: PRD domain-containing protein [Eubacteriales bacterium]|nr:PRD domain-containing protein [Eubacteriales bacterium]
MNSRKTTILEKIMSYTRESILDNSFSFEQCNAYEISLELKIDRSNVSRILNQLFNEYKLIKISGRPTTYLSRDVIVQEFRYSKAPQILESKEALKEQLAFNAPVTGNALEKFHMIGSSTGESLCDIIDKILPCFIFPQEYPLMIVLYGEAGSGKKNFCEQLFQYAIKKKTFRKQSRSLTVTYHPEAPDNEYILEQIQTDNTAMILIEVFDPVSETDAYHIRETICNLYRNKNCRQPLIIFSLTEGATDPKVFYPLTPCVVHFPSLSQRTPMERTRLILSFMQDASDKNQIHFRFNHDVLTMLLSAKYKYNIFQLQNEIYYAVSNSIYFARDNFATLLPHSLSGQLRKNQNDNPNYLREITSFVENTIPHFVDFYPGTPCALLDLLSSDSTCNLRLPKIRKTFHEKIRDDVLRTEVLLTDQVVDEQFHNILRFCFAQTRMEHDLPLLNRLYSIIQEMLHGTFVIDCVEGNQMPDLSKTTVKTSSALFEKIQISFGSSLSKSYRDYLRLFIEYALEALNASCVSYVIVTHTRQIAQNYALYMNYITGTRTYYAIDYTYEDQTHYARFLKKAQTLLKNLDKSREIILMSDKAPLNNLSTLMVRKTNQTILSLSPISLPMLMRTARIMKEENLHGMTTVRNIIYAKKEMLQDYNRKVSSFPNEYISQNISQYFEQFFDSTNTTLANKLFFNITKNVFQHFNCDLTAGLVLESLLHCNFLLARSMDQKEIFIENSDVFIQEYPPLYQYVKEQFDRARELLTLNISEKELVVLCEMFINNMDTV